MSARRHGSKIEPLSEVRSALIPLAGAIVGALAPSHSGRRSRFVDQSLQDLASASASIRRFPQFRSALKSAAIASTVSAKIPEAIRDGGSPELGIPPPGMFAADGTNHYSTFGYGIAPVGAPNTESYYTGAANYYMPRART